MLQSARLVLSPASRHSATARVVFGLKRHPSTVTVWRSCRPVFGHTWTLGVVGVRVHEVCAGAPDVVPCGAPLVRAGWPVVRALPCSSGDAAVAELDAAPPAPGSRVASPLAVPPPGCAA